MKKFLLLFVLGMIGCVTVPQGVTPVDHFDLHRYLGRWYEIARLDHAFERGLSDVTAEYTLNPDGSLRVINRGYADQENKWKEVEGRAYFVKRPDQGFLKVSFFGPFYGSYVIFDLDDKGYSHALVCGPNRSYFWLLARSPDMEDDVKKRLIARAAALGFDTHKLIYVRHSR
ncbi:MAG: lipocalin family protein [Smithellaceae bacterium]